MFANRFTALVDACSLAGALKRNLLLSLAEADFYRLRWSTKILDETEKAIIDILTKKEAKDPQGHAAYTRGQMEQAFQDATVEGYDLLLPSVQGLPDANDAHVVAAAIMTRAHVIVTDNLKDFPAEVLGPLGLSVVSTDDFLANTIALNEAAENARELPATRNERREPASKDRSCRTSGNRKPPQRLHRNLVAGVSAT